AAGLAPMPEAAHSPGAGAEAARVRLKSATRISRLSTSTQIGNSSATQTKKCTATSRRAAIAYPSTASQRGPTVVRSRIVEVAIAQDADEPQERDPGERHQRQSEEHQVASCRVRQPVLDIGLIARHRDPDRDDRDGDEDREGDTRERGGARRAKCR